MNDRLNNVIHGSLDTQFSPSFCVSTAFKWDWSIPNFGIQARAQQLSVKGTLPRVTSNLSSTGAPNMV